MIHFNNSSVTNCTEPSPSLSNICELGSYISMAIVIFGLFGNCLTLIVMLSKDFRRQAMSTYLVSLSISDTFFIFLWLFNKQIIRNMFGFDVRATSTVGCHIFFILFKTTKLSSSWIVVLVCIERFVAVVFPTKHRVMYTRRKAMASIAAAVITIGTLCCFWTVSTGIVDKSCVPNVGYPDIIEVVHGFLITGTVVYAYLPATILLVLHMFIIYHLKQQTTLRQRLTSNHIRISETQRSTVLVAIVTLTFLCLVPPIAALHNICFVLKVNLFETTSKPLVVAREILQLLEISNYSFNFVLYVIVSKSFSNWFRRRYRRWRGKVQPQVSTVSRSGLEDLTTHMN